MRGSHRISSRARNARFTGDSTIEVKKRPAAPSNGGLQKMRGIGDGNRAILSVVQLINTSIGRKASRHISKHPKKSCVGE
jgi:hypothetical protein